jgi:hypothetical protein
MLQYITKHWSQEHGMYLNIKHVRACFIYHASSKDISDSYLLLNDSKLILSDQEGYSDSFIINVESSRTYFTQTNKL